MLFCDFVGVGEIVRSENRPTWHEATDDGRGGLKRKEEARGKNRPTSDGEEERTCERGRKRAGSAFPRKAELRRMRK